MTDDGWRMRDGLTYRRESPRRRKPEGSGLPVPSSVMSHPSSASLQSSRLTGVSSRERSPAPNRMNRVRLLAPLLAAAAAHVFKQATDAAPPAAFPASASKRSCRGVPDMASEHGGVRSW